MNKLLLWFKRNPLASALLMLALSATAAWAISPTPYDVRSATDMPVEFKTLWTNLMGSIAFLTGVGVVLTAIRSALGVAAGLVRSAMSG